MSHNSGARLKELCTDLIGNTKYVKSAFREDAPAITSCLTILHYIFKQTVGVDVSLDYIGNMPRKLLFEHSWHIISVDDQELMPGDVVFVKEIGMKTLISHVGIAIGPQGIFHSSKTLQTAAVESTAKFFSQYEQKLNLVEMMLYIDRRSVDLREACKGNYISLRPALLLWD